jgi:hypothetical protein
MHLNKFNIIFAPQFILNQKNIKMKKFTVFFAALAIMISACNNSNSNEGEATDSLKTAQVQLPLIKLIEFDSLAANYVDQEVEVKGVVDHVCRHGGKRLFLVDDEGSVHIDWTERFSDSIAGSHIAVKGIVREFRVDESYCLQQEQDNIMKHKEGQTDKESFEQKKKQLADYRNSMKSLGVDHLSFYSIDYVSHKVE